MGLLVGTGCKHLVKFRFFYFVIYFITVGFVTSLEKTLSQLDSLFTIFMFFFGGKQKSLEYNIYIGQWCVACLSLTKSPMYFLLLIIA